MGRSPGTMRVARERAGPDGEVAVSIFVNPLQFEPGSQWKYGSGLTVVGRIIEIVSGHPFDRFLEERIFRPLAMKDTSSGSAVADRLEDADVVLTDRSYYRRNPQALREAEARGIPIYVLRSNSPLQLESCLADIFGIERRSSSDPFEEAAEETRAAIEDVRSGRRSSVDLSPQNAFMRRKQHEMAREADLLSHSHGKEPRRSVRIYQNNG